MIDWLCNSCKEHIAGRRCDKCEVGYAGFPRCRQCDCEIPGVTEQVCDQQTSQCLCKSNVQGDRCSECKPNSFYLEERNPNGCTQCFCFGVTTRCEQSQLRRDQVPCQMFSPVHHYWFTCTHTMSVYKCLTSQLSGFSLDKAALKSILEQELISYRYSSRSCSFGVTSSKSLRLHCYKSDRYEIWHDCSSSKYSSIYWVRFPIWCHNFKRVAMWSICRKHHRLRGSAALL